MQKYFTFLFFGCFLITIAFSQKITYSPLLKKETLKTDFKIIGKNGNDFLVYKNNYRKHYITYYNESMEFIGDVDLDIIPEKALQVDFLNQKENIIVVYQYQKNNIVYCDAIKVSESGKKISVPVNLDTTYIGYFSDNKIYGTSFSEDKNLILIYKQNIKNNSISLATKLFDQNFNLLESFRNTYTFNQRKEDYSDFYVDNDGSFIYIKTRREKYRSLNNEINFVVKKRGADTSVNINLPLNGKLIDQAYIKADNLNKNYIINSFYYNVNRGHLQGLYTAKIPANQLDSFTTAANPFPQNIVESINSGNIQNAIDDLTPQQIILKKNGGFLLLAESIYTETLNASNVWNRNYYGSYPYSSYDYLPYNPYGYSQFWNNYNRTENTRYFFSDIMISEIDSTNQFKWSNIIHKSQSDINTDDFLSYAMMNSGGEIGFLYLDKNNQKEIVTHTAVDGVGEIKKYPTLKSNERGYEFMPKLGKQIGYNQIIIPFLYFNNLGFAKIDFNL